MTSPAKHQPGEAAGPETTSGTPPVAERRGVPRGTLATAGAVASILLVAAVLRPALTAFGPVVERIDAELGLGSTALGVLGSLPVVCFALVSAIAHVPARRYGIERVVLAALVVLAAGLALRFAPGQAPLWIGTALVGVGIAVGNVLLPSAVKQWFPSRVSLLSGIYSSVLVLFAALGSGLSVPIAEAAGGNWRVALGAALPIVLIAIAWWAVRVARSMRAEAPAESTGTSTDARAAADGDAIDADRASGETRAIDATRPIDAPRASGAVAAAAAVRRSAPRPPAQVWTSPTAWFVTGYMGLQSLHFYVTVTWLPSIERAAGVSDAASGWHLSISQVVGMLIGLVFTALMGRRQDQRVVATIASLPVIIGCAGLWIAPATVPALWAAMLGAGQGSSLVIALALIALRTATPTDTTRLSAMSQGVGYGLAAIGPFLAGALHDLSGSWLPVLVLVAGAALGQAFVGYRAGGDVTVGASAASVRTGLDDEENERQ